ncbi:EsV-1-1 [Ectocarpus siliculosus virus 1]|uniref:EsV-1-1 n=1 Tax=Ectocarpus siliculosus virus 1 (isolate New Zealand/Kaikoura/1988) TaxID=654926 RepID=Q8QNQ8_ESV1K|nr:EsV-1-1 [Ectocarpus siliculosus virus 1]AAK14427.1 EsV-1-1 [Ectocarpus siliculosus virus 1]
MVLTILRHTIIIMPSTVSTLYSAASTGSVERTLDLLSDGFTEIDKRCDENGVTALMCAANKGYLRIVRVLLRFGADVSVSTDDGHTALHFAIGGRNLAVTRALIRAGADVGAKADLLRTESEVIQGQTPLHLATGEGFCEGMVALINAGANVDSRMSDGSTAMYIAACMGNLEAIEILLQKKANPLLRVGPTHPLDIATHGGHLRVVQELVQRFGIDGCADEGAIGALETAAYENHQTILAFLLDAGVIDTDGTALCDAIEGRNEACLKLLVSRRGGNAHMVERNYTNIDNAYENPLLCAFGTGRGHAPRITRFLLDHGADTKKKVRFEIEGLGEMTDEPLAAAKITLRHEQTYFEDADAEGVDGLKGVVRLLQQEDAVHANSWAWPTDTDRATKIVRKPIRPGSRPKVLLAAMGRCVEWCQ